MIATLELESVSAQTCPSCGAVHRFRAVVLSDDSPECPTMLGFFTRCSTTGERVWLVVTAPEGSQGRMVEVGPIDDEQWMPEVTYEPHSSGRFTCERRAVGSFALAPGVRKRSAATGGALPKLLRLAWGCPY